MDERGPLKIQIQILKLRATDCIKNSMDINFTIVVERNTDFEKTTETRRGKKIKYEYWPRDDLLLSGNVQLSKCT
jgi:hypothetical protein